MHTHIKFLRLRRALTGVFSCLFLFTAPAAFACAPPLAINHAAPPPKNEQVVTSVVGDTTLAFVPYGQSEHFVEYRVWAMDKACRAVEVPVEETLGNGSTRENGLVCAHFVVSEDAVQCTLQEDKVVGYHYLAGGLQADNHATGKSKGGKLPPNSGRAGGGHNSVVVYGGKKGKAK